MSTARRLDEYQRKRHFDRTTEPHGRGRRRGGSDDPIFVIQHHDASSDHYDFRLQVGDVLKSWAVPKGPSTNPKDKRLAVPTEDHPMDYASFEGTIPDGEYGAGTVLVWDTGTYRNTSRHQGEDLSLDDALDRGHATFRLDGEKLSGGYALTRIRTGKDESWLLVKQDDDGADARRRPVRTQPESVRSGRTLDEIARDGE
ncbi:MAG: DNA polymerase ligase N-terminal domain-containing protein [Actinocatenispora sp.]